jgi:hypothetical protein
VSGGEVSPKVAAKTVDLVMRGIAPG